MGQKVCKLWVSIENANTLDYVAMIKLISLTIKRDLLPKKFWKSVWKLPVDDLVEFINTCERQAKCVCKLCRRIILTKATEDNMGDQHTPSIFKSSDKAVELGPLNFAQ